MNNHYLSLIILLLSFAMYAQQKVESVQLKEDTNQAIEIRTFDEQLSAKYRGEEFNYDVKDGEALNLIEGLLQWIFQALRDNFGIHISPVTMQIIEYFIYILMGGVVIYLLVKFLIGENVSAIFKKNSSGIIDINLSEDHIELVDLDALLHTALAEKDFRLAIRYRYLKALKILSQKGIINWHFEKTNWDYLKEISMPSVKSHFKEVSYIYDYIWYGEQYIDEEIYGAAEARFQALDNQIHN